MNLVVSLACGRVDDGDGLAGGRLPPLPFGVVLVHIPVYDLLEHASAGHLLPHRQPFLSDRCTAVGPKRRRWDITPNAELQKVQGGV